MVNKTKEREHQRMVRFVRMADCLLRSALERFMRSNLSALLASFEPFMGLPVLEPLPPDVPYLTREEFDEWDEYHSNMGEGSKAKWR